MEISREYGTFILRLFLGFGFLVAGLFKLTHLQSVAEMFTGLFGGAGTFFLWVTLAVETIGGIFLLIGLFTRWAAAFLAVVMIVAGVVTFNIQAPDFFFALNEIFVLNQSGSNLPATFMYLGALISLMISGSQTLAVRPE